MPIHSWRCRSYWMKIFREKIFLFFCLTDEHLGSGNNAFPSPHAGILQYSQMGRECMPLAKCQHVQITFAVDVARMPLTLLATLLWTWNRFLLRLWGTVNSHLALAKTGLLLVGLVYVRTVKPLGTGTGTSKRLLALHSFLKTSFLPNMSPFHQPSC